MSSNRDATDQADDARPPAPRWVKVFGILIALFVVVFAIVHLTGNGMGNHRLR
jgi:hypothetical protein